jgi:hypothetical protein
MVLEPGESTGLHTHSRDYLFYVVEGSPGELTDERGNLLGKLEAKDGETMFFRLEGQELVAGNYEFLQPTMLEMWERAVTERFSWKPND